MAPRLFTYVIVVQNVLMYLGSVENAASLVSLRFVEAACFHWCRAWQISPLDTGCYTTILQMQKTLYVVPV